MPNEISFLPVIRVIALALECDGPMISTERTWLERLMITHHLTDQERRVIEADAQNPPKLWDVFQSMPTFDLDQMPRFIETALGVDGRLTPNEIAFHQQCLDLVAQFTPRRPPFDPLSDAQSRLADELVVYADRVKLWQKLNEAGRSLRADARPWRRFFVSWWF